MITEREGFGINTGLSFFSLSGFFLFFGLQKKKMLSQGLSHFVLNASTEQELQQTIEFYQAFGFNLVSDRPSEEKTIWLKSESNTTISLVLNTNTKKQEKPSTESDWSSKEVAFAFSSENINVIAHKKIFFVHAVYL